MMSRKQNDQQYNPYLKAALLEVVDNQLRADNPPEVKETFNRLVSQGISKEDAKIYIAQAVCVETYNILKHKKPFDLKRYVKNLKHLPDEPEE